MELIKIILFSLFVHLSAQEETVKAAGIIVFRHIDSRIEYLVLKPSNPYAKWSPPKGHVDDNENFFETAIREVKEETNLDLNDLEIYLDEHQQTNYPNMEGKKKIVNYWLAKLKDVQKVPKLSDEHVEYRWLTKEEIKSMTVNVHPEFANLLDKFDMKNIV